MVNRGFVNDFELVGPFFAQCMVLGAASVKVLPMLCVAHEWSIVASRRSECDIRIVQIAESRPCDFVLLSPGVLSIVVLLAFCFCFCMRVSCLGVYTRLCERAPPLSRASRPLRPHE